MSVSTEATAIPSGQSAPDSQANELLSWVDNYLASEADKPPGLLPVTLADAVRVSEGFNLRPLIQGSKRNPQVESEDDYGDRIEAEVLDRIPRQTHRSLLNTCTTMKENPHTIPAEFYKSPSDYKDAQSIFKQQNEEVNKDGTSKGCYDSIKDLLWLTPDDITQVGTTAAPSFAKRAAETARVEALNWRKTFDRAWEDYQSKLSTFKTEYSKFRGSKEERASYKANKMPKFNPPPITTMESVSPVVNHEDGSFCWEYKIRKQEENATKVSHSPTVKFDSPTTIYDEFSGASEVKSDPSFESAWTLSEDDLARSNRTFERRFGQLASGKDTHKGKKVKLLQEMTERTPTEEEGKLAMKLAEGILLNDEELLPVITRLSEHPQGSYLTSLMQFRLMQSMQSEGGGTQTSAGSIGKAPTESKKSLRSSRSRRSGGGTLGGTTPSMVSTAA